MYPATMNTDINQTNRRVLISMGPQFTNSPAWQQSVSEQFQTETQNAALMATMSSHRVNMQLLTYWLAESTRGPSSG